MSFQELVAANESERKRKAEQDVEQQAAKKAKEEIRYRTKTAKTDLQLVCNDGVSLYYSKYQLSLHSPVMDAALDDAEAGELKIDFPSGYVELGLRFMDRGRFCFEADSQPTPKTAHTLYKLAHYWGCEEMEAAALKSALMETTYELLQDMKQRHSTSYPEAVKKLLAHGKQLPPVVDDLVAEHQRVAAELAVLRKFKLKIAECQGRVAEVARSMYAGNDVKQVAREMAAALNV